MDLKSFKEKVSSLDLSKYPSMVKNWKFQETRNCLIAECDSNSPLLKGKGYSIYYWKEDVAGKMQLMKSWETRQGVLLEEFE